MHVTWAGMESFLSAAANISKTLYGTGDKKLAEFRRPIRESLEIDESSPLYSRKLRNHLEHFDERLDQWYKTSTQKNFVDFNTGPRNSIILGGSDEDMFRNYDDADKVVTFWGGEYPIQPIADAISDLLPKANREAGKPHWNTA